jgi:hypothetical protein
VHKKVLIITYYWPPGGGAGVQRWLKFTKYLAEFGWTPVIYTPSNGEMPVTDNSLLADVPSGTEVIRKPIWEPYSIYKAFIGAGKGEKINTGFLTEKKKPGLAQKIAVWMRGNLFIPDARRFWIRPSVSFLKKHLAEHPVQAIVSTGPPHSMHLIALEVSKALGVPWLADFRDPWTNIDYYKDLMLSAAADRKHHELEKKVVTGADRVVVIGNTMRSEFESQFNRKVDVITNGYDEADISPVNNKPDAFVVAHVGTLVKTRNPYGLWSSLKTLISENPGFASALQIRLTGKVDIAVRESLESFGLIPYTLFTEYIPHNQIAREQQGAAVLLLLLNDTPNAKGILTGKLFEYLAAARPVLCVGPPDGDAAAILKETASGQCFNFTDANGIKQFLLEHYNSWSTGRYELPGREVESYSRRNLTARLAGILDEIAK